MIKCDFDDALELKCSHQSVMLKRGNVMLDGYIWKKKDKLTKNDYIWLEEMPDFCHVHTSEKCLQVMKKYYPKEYLKHCEYFGVKP